MIAFTFPGQGSQAVGMGRAFVEASGAAKARYAEAADALGLDIARLSFEGPESELQLTANTQPAVLTASVAAAAACAERGLAPALAAGHSLGEYSALVVAGALPFADAVRLVRRRGELMQAAVPLGVGAMAAILGLDLATVEAICLDAAEGEIVSVANINSPAQIVIAGHRPAVERALRHATARGGRRSVMLPVSAPFHCSLMRGAADALATELAHLPLRDPTIPVVRNTDAGVSRKAADVRDGLIQQVASPVRWTECVARLALEGADAFIEVGPGRVLTGLLKRITDRTRGFSVETPLDLDRALGGLGRA